MSLNLPSDSEGSPRICPTEGTNTQRSEVPGIGLSWKKKTTRAGETPDGRLHIGSGEFQGSKGSVCFCISAQTSQGVQRGRTCSVAHRWAEMYRDQVLVRMF